MTGSPEERLRVGKTRNPFPEQDPEGECVGEGLFLNRTRKERVRGGELFLNRIRKESVCGKVFS